MSERKYRQAGYQDSGDEGRRQRRRPAAPSSRTGPSRGRGLGKPTVTVCRCAVCGTKQEAVIELDSQCSQCGAALHTCTHCVHFDTSATFECRQPIPARISSKAKANECEHFSARSTQEMAGDSAEPSDPKAAFDALFKNL